MARGEPITLRLTIADPGPALAYSLCDKKNAAVDPKVAGDAPISFDVPVRAAAGPRFFGDFVRSEGPARQFVYVSLGAYAGDPASLFGGRMKVDIHDIPPALIDKALAGAVLQALLPGRDKKGGPAYASVKSAGWTVSG